MAKGKKIKIVQERGASGTAIFSGRIYDDYNADLRGQSGIEIFDKMRKSDGMVKAIISALSLPIRSAEWSVDCKDDNLKDFIKEALFNKMDMSFDEFVYHALLMLPFGYSVFEKVYKVENGKVYWRKFAPRLPKTIWEWHTDENGNLTGLKQFAIKNGKYVYIDLDIKDLLVFTLDKEGSNFEGTSVLRAAYKHWYIKDNLYDIVNIGLERQAIGLPIIELGDNANDNDVTAAETFVRTVRCNEETGLVLPNGSKAQILEGKLKSDDVLQNIRHQDTMIAKSVLAEFLQLGNDGNSGSYALSKDKTNFFMMSLNAIAKNICYTFNEIAIKQLIDYNFGAVKEYPKLKCNLGGLDSNKIIEGVARLVQTGVITAEENTEEFVRQLLGLPQVKIDNMVSKDKKLSEGIKLNETKRDLTKWEKGVKFAEIDNLMNIAEKTFLEKVKGVSDKQVDDLLKQIKKLLERNEVKDLYKITVRHRGEYVKIINDTMNNLADWALNNVSEETGVKNIEVVSSKLKQYFKTKTDAIVEKQVAELKGRAMLTAIEGVGANVALDRIMFNTKESIKKFYQRQLTGTAQVIVTDAINKGRDEILRSNEFQAAQYSAILDRKTCPLCERLDGMVIDLDDPDFKRFTPPVHSSCRCIWVYIRKDEDNVDINFKTPASSLIENHGQLVQ